MTLYKTLFFLQEICSYSCIDILTLLFNYNQMKMTYLSGHPPNMNSIGEVCDSLGTDSLTLFVGNHWVTLGLGEGGNISDPLFAYTELKYNVRQSVGGVPWAWRSKDKPTDINPLTLYWILWYLYALFSYILGEQALSKAFSQAHYKCLSNTGNVLFVDHKPFWAIVFTTLNKTLYTTLMDTMLKKTDTHRKHNKTIIFPRLSNKAK